MHPALRVRRVRARVPAIVGGVLTAVLVAACGATAGAEASPVATDTVHLPPSYRFQPGTITVPAGTTVTWTNDDHFTHNVDLADDPAEPPVMRPGESVRLTFATPGRFAYVCSFHPNDMRGVIVVTAAP